VRWRFLCPACSRSLSNAAIRPSVRLSVCPIHLAQNGAFRAMNTKQRYRKPNAVLEVESTGQRTATEVSKTDGAYRFGAIGAIVCFTLYISVELLCVAAAVSITVAASTGCVVKSVIETCRSELSLTFCYPLLFCEMSVRVFVCALSPCINITKRTQKPIVCL